MPMQVTVSRGNPMPWPIALLLTIVGGGLIVLGFTVIPAIDDVASNDTFSNTIMTVIAAILVIPAWVIAILVVLKKLVHGKPDYAVDVPEELPEPPCKDGADIVGMVIGAGDPPRRTVAGTLLELASKNTIDIQEFGEKVVVTIPHLLAGVSGYKLSPGGETAKAQWGAFARFLREQGSFRDVRPAGVAVWGPNLAYAAVLGVAKKAARPLTPGVDDEDVRDEAGLTQTQVYEL